MPNTTTRIVSISLEHGLYDQALAKAEALAKERGQSPAKPFSAYVAKLIIDDLDRRISSSATDASSGKQRKLDAHLEREVYRAAVSKPSSSRKRG